MWRWGFQCRPFWSLVGTGFHGEKVVIDPSKQVLDLTFMVGGLILAYCSLVTRYFSLILVLVFLVQAPPPSNS